MEPVPFIGWKIFTHDRCSPIQTGKPLWKGTFPVKLRKVALDTGPAECAAGWNYCAEIPAAWQIAGMWPTGRPSLVVQVEASRDAIARGKKCRASQLTLLRAATPKEIAHALHEFSKPFGELRLDMATEQLTWRHALARPRSNVKVVEVGLLDALKARELRWVLKRFDSTRDAWAAWAARDVWAARDAWDARAAWDAWAAWDARAVWAAWAAWAARDAWDARAARDAWDARAALIHYYAARRGWIPRRADHFTVGIRDAYENGLELALPTGPGELGWVLAS